MAKRNDSSQVKACLSDSSESKNGRPDQHRHGTSHDSGEDLMNFSEDDDTSKITSFESPTPSAVASLTTDTTCLKPGSGEEKGTGRESKWKSGSEAGAEGVHSAGREDSMRGHKHWGPPSGTSREEPKPSSSGSGERGGSEEKISESRRDQMRSESSSAAIENTRKRPTRLSSWEGDRLEEGVSESSGHHMWSERSGASSWTTRETPEWTVRRACDCNVNLAPLYYTADHTVLINVNEFARNKTVKPVNGRPQWDASHVKMPQAVENTYIKSGLFNASVQRWSTISKQLKKLQTRSLTVADVEKAIKSYNPQYEKSWFFTGLQRYAEQVPPHIFSTVIPNMVDLALGLPDLVPRAIPLLKQGKSHSITLSQLQIAALLANAFFCTFPRRNSTAKTAEYANYPTINFSSLFGLSTKMTVEKLKAILHYFDTVTASPPTGLVTFERCCIPDTRLPHWRRRTEHLRNVHVTSEGSIEREGRGMLQVDFACSVVGGGVLGSGLVQEEILFLMNPELIVARLFTEKLSDNECLKIIGSQQYSEYEGYSSYFQWKRPHHDELLRDEWRRRQRQIVAIDALNFRHPKEQYHKLKIRRELNKAFVGFSEEGRFPDELPTIATGNWGCGAFHGDPILKGLIQMMAAAVAKRDLMFFTFGDNQLEHRLMKIYAVLKGRKTVGEIYDMLDFFCQSPDPHKDLYRFILTYMNSPL